MYVSVRCHSFIMCSPNLTKVKMCSASFIYCFICTHVNEDGSSFKDTHTHTHIQTMKTKIDVSCEEFIGFTIAVSS